MTRWGVFYVHVHFIVAVFILYDFFNIQVPFNEQV